MSFSRTEHIAAGQLKSSPNSSQVFQAYLGTCLGVALYDDTLKIGGMIHILLPEPPGLSETDTPEKYASTGIPLLIRQMTALGSTPKSIKASIAGGALVSPISQQDMGLDIGGRSADIAQDILKALDIEIIKSETGGFFTCTLELNLGTGETSITPAWKQAKLPSTTFDPPKVREIQATIDHLKPIPQTALKILRMVQGSQHGATDITHELSQDQVLSAQTLKLCNSALFAGTMKIDTLKDAVLLLGQDMLVKSVITAAVNDYYNQAGTSGYSLCRGGLFFHAVGVATTAEHLAQKTGKDNPKQAYTAGLLHDIGKVILDQYISQIAPLLFRDLAGGRDGFLKAEKRVLGITHCRAGAFLAEKWQFSDALTQVICHHHRPEEAKKNKDLVAIVYLADLLMEKFHAGNNLEVVQTRSMGAVLDLLGLDIKELPELIDALPLSAITHNETPND